MLRDLKSTWPARFSTKTFCSYSVSVKLGIFGELSGKLVGMPSFTCSELVFFQMDV